MLTTNGHTYETGTLFDLRPATEGLDPIVARLERSIAGPSGYIMRRLLLVNYWHFDYEEMVIPHGRLFLLGDNGSGKSTILGATLPLLLDGLVRPERLDTFGANNQRKIDYYVLGQSPTGGVEHQRRTSYVALEFAWHDRDAGSTATAPLDRATGQPPFLTIGIGFAGRAGTDEQVHPYRFVITSGKRLGIDIPLKSEDGKVYDVAYFRSIVKEHGVVAERQSEYRDLVARHLFGYEDPAVLDRLIDVLLLLRKPGLSNEIRTFDEVYNYLKRALPPLPADVTKTTTEAFERIDVLRQMGYKFGRQAVSAQHIHEVDLDLAQAKLRLRAWPVIVAERAVLRAANDRQLARRDLERAERRYAEIQGEHQHLTREHLAVEGEVAELTASARAQDLAAIEAALVQAEEKVGVTRRWLEQQDSGLAEAQRALTEQRASLESQQAAWRRYGQSAGQRLIQLERLAGLGRWSEGQVWVAQAAQELAAIRRDDSAAGLTADALPFPAPETELLPLIQERRQKVAELQQANEEYERFSVDEREAKRRHDDRRRAMAAADVALADARRALISSWVVLAAGLGWQAEESAAEGFLSLDDLVAAAARQSRADLAEALATLHRSTAEHADRLARLLEQRSRELGQIEKQIDDLDRQIVLREAETDLAPARLPHREQARAALREAGIDARPLYTLFDFAAELAPDLQGPVERMLADAGLLDALILRESDETAADMVLGVRGLADCRLVLPDSPPREGALGQVLAVEGAETNPTWRALGQRILGSIGLADVGDQQFMAGARLQPDGAWRHGLLAGQAGSEGPLGFVGATQRAARRQREIDALRDALRELRERRDELAANRDRQRRERERLQLAVRSVEQAADLTAIVSGETRTHERELALAEVQTQELAAASELSEATKRRELLAGQIGEAMAILGATEPDRVLVATAQRSFEGMESETGSLQNDLNRLAEVAVAISQLRSGLTRIEERVHLADAALADARIEVTNAERALGRARERLIDGDLEKFRRQLAAARDQEAWLRGALLTKAEEIGVGKTEVAREQDALIADEARVAEAERGRSIAVTTLDQLVQLNPDALAGAVPETEVETIALATTLCPADTTDARAFERQAEVARDGRRKVFDEERAQLVEFDLSIAEDERDRVVVRLAQSAEGPLLDLLETIQQRLRENELLLNAEEERLFKDYLADTGLTAIHRSVQNADGLIARMNQILERTLLGRERYELRMEHRADRLDQLTPLARHHALFRKDPQAISDEERRVLFEAVRGAVADAHRRMEEGEGEGDFADLLAKAFDYREWFSLGMFVTDATGQRTRISSRMARTRSGAQQLFALYVPLFAALAALYESAAAWAPHLFAMDEAFDKISEDNVTILLRFLVDLHFQWIVASPRLSGAGREVLPACADWQLYHNAVDKLAQAFPVLYSDGSIFDDPAEPWER